MKIFGINIPRFVTPFTLYVIGQARFGPNERVFLDQPEGRNPQDEAFGFFRRVV